MSVREIATVGDPVLRERARELSLEELRSAEVQRLIDDMIETMRAANGAGLAANQVGETAAGRGDRGAARQPALPLQAADPADRDRQPRPSSRSTTRRSRSTRAACRSRTCAGTVPRFVNVRVRYLDRDGQPHEEVRRGLTAGTFQHEVDHLDGVLFVDRVRDPTTFTTWEQFERHHRDEFVERAAQLVERVGS